MRLLLYILSFIPFLLVAQNTEYLIEHAKSVILDTYGDVVTVKDKDLVKFGRNDDLGTSEETVWLTGGTETYATGNTIDSLVSSNNGDTQQVIIEGHTINGGYVNFYVQTATLTGQTPVALGQGLWRGTRVKNNGSTDFAGTVYLYSGGAVTNGVPDVADSIHCQAKTGDNQSKKAATALSSVDYWVITGVTVAVDKAQARSVDFELQVREYGKVFRTIDTIPASSTGSNIVHIPYIPYIIVPPRSDVRMVATSNNTGTGVTASIQGFLLLKQ